MSLGRAGSVLADGGRAGRGAGAVWPLWCFRVGPWGAHVLTRGRTSSEAAAHLARANPGGTVRPCRDVSTDAARLYSRNHEPGWLSRAPRWTRDHPTPSPTEPRGDREPHE